MAEYKRYTLPAHRYASNNEQPAVVAIFIVLSIVSSACAPMTSRFRRSSARSVVHADGYEVHEALPRYAEYREGDHVLRFGAELTGRKSRYDIILYANGAVRWQPPFDGEELSAERVGTIVERVSAGLAALRINPLWVRH